ncbi:hypothetical protein D030_1132A, partial [Vibrio parahaemolyticus AQ3810]
MRDWEFHYAYPLLWSPE